MMKAPYPDYVFKIIAKHMGFKIFAVIQPHKNIALERGKIKDVTPELIRIDSEVTKESNVKVPFFIDSKQNILNLYNRNSIDMLQAKEVSNMAAKMRNKGLQLVIIKSIKSYLKKEVTIIAKQGNEITLTRGKLTNMGISGLSVLTAPFYNNEMSIPYTSILNIYNDSNVDLIDI